MVFLFRCMMRERERCLSARGATAERAARLRGDGNERGACCWAMRERCDAQRSTTGFLRERRCFALLWDECFLSVCVCEGAAVRLCERLWADERGALDLRAGVR